MGNNTNPAEIYSGTTWELLPDNKFLKTGSTPLQQAGSNNIKLTKANLPTDKLQVESHSMTRGTMDIKAWTGLGIQSSEISQVLLTEAFYWEKISKKHFYPWGYNTNDVQLNFQASRSWTGSTSSASPYTTAMGSGTPITVNPEHITVKAWKRLS